MRRLRRTRGLFHGKEASWALDHTRRTCAPCKRGRELNTVVKELTCQTSARMQCILQRTSLRDLGEVWWNSLDSNQNPSGFNRVLCLLSYRSTKGSDPLESGCGCGLEPPLRFHRATCRPYTNPHKCKTGTSLRGPRAKAEIQARGGPLCTRSLPANGRCSRSLFSVSRDNMAPPVLRSVTQSYPVHVDVSSVYIDASMV